MSWTQWQKRRKLTRLCAKSLLILSITIIISVAVLRTAWAGGYAETLVSELRPRHGQIPESVRYIYTVAIKAESDADYRAAWEAYSRLADVEDVPAEIRTYFLAQKALLSEGQNMYPTAMETLRTIKQLRPEPEAERIRFLVDLEIARAMADSGGHPLLPDFDPAMEEKEAQFSLLFSTYSPYRAEILDAHIRFAHECHDATYESGELMRYAVTALEHLRTVQDIVEEMEANPSLAHDKLTSDTMQHYSQRARQKLISWKKSFLSRLPENREGDEIRMAVEKTDAPQLAQYRLHVTDADGQPVNHIFVQGAVAYGREGPVTRETASVDTGTPVQALDGDDGRFILREWVWHPTVWISAGGTGRELFSAENLTSEEPVHITLHPASKITIRVQDYGGDLMSGVAVGPAEVSERHRPSNFYALPKTDLNGEVVFDRLPPGSYGYRLHMTGKLENNRVQFPDVWPRLVAFEVEPGETYERTIQFGVPPERSTAKLLYDWEKEYRKMPRERDLTPRKIQESARRELAGLVTARLEELPGRYRFEAREAARLAAAAEGYGLSGTVPALQDMLARWLSAGEYVSYDRQLRAVAHAVVALAGDDAVPFFAAAATDARFLYEVRRESVIGLGQIGTDKSVAAFVKLRDAAFGKPGAPERKESYTHAEKMAETVEMVFNVIPRLPVDEAPPPLATVSPEDAWVSEEFTEGHIGCRMPGGGYTQIMMRRFGDEWLIGEFGQTVIS